MTNSASFDPLPPFQGNTNIEQSIKGDRNQTIGQVLGGMVVYVNGGQAVFNTGRDEPETSPKSAPIIGPNPYRGLMAFQETDGDRFFGREKQIADLWAKLRQLHETESAIRLLPIYGPSGSGKSSLARAGLIPELARRPIPGYDRARVAVLVPGTHPLESLAAVLARIATNDLTPVTKTREFATELAQKTQTNEYDGLRRIANVLPDITISPLIVLVDQFEEVYTLCKSQQERDTFIANLLCAASDRARRVSVIVTLRSDFLGETQKHPMLNTLFAEQGFLVRSMNGEELRQAIAKPAESAGHSLDAATIDLLVKDTEGREGALPLLQFALTRIWEGLAEGKQPAETLEVIGGVGGALAGEAQRIYEQLGIEEQEIARRVFLGLVQLGEGTKDTRRRVRFDSLVSYQNQPEQVKRVIELFSAPGARLITLAAVGSTETAEVTHEALFDHWQQLQTWLEGNRSDIRFQRRLDEAARYWAEQGRPEGNLWRPPDLDLLKRYQQRAGEDMTPLQVEFFNASARSENLRKRLRRISIGGLVAGLILTTSSTIFAIYQLQRAQYRRAEQLAATAEALLPTQSANALINAIAAVGLSKSILVRLPSYSNSASDPRSLLHPMLINREKILLKHKRAVYSTAFSPDGKTIASGTTSGHISLWNAITGQLVMELLTEHTLTVYSVVFSPDGKTIASGSGDRSIRLWNASTGKPIRGPLLGHQDAIISVAFSPDGRTIVSGSLDNTVRLWDARTGNPIGQPLRGHEQGIEFVAFSPDGTTIASGSLDNTVRLWDTRTGNPIGQPLRGHKNAIYSVAFSRDGRTIVSASRDGTLRLWDARTGTPIGQPLDGHEDAIYSVAVSSDGKTIASSGVDSTIRLWNIKTGQPIGQPLRGHENAVRFVTFSADGKTIASGSWDNTVRLWDMSLSNPIGQPLLNHEQAILSVAFNPNGKTIASSSDDTTIQRWNASTGQLIGSPLRGHEDAVTSVAFSPDGKTIASGSLDNTLRLWNAETGQSVGNPLRGHDAKVLSIAFSPDSRTIVSGSWDKTIRLWSTKTGQPVGKPLRGHNASIYAIAVSPDGKTIASGSFDNTVRLWDISAGQPLGMPLKGHTDMVSSVAFSPDGKIVISGSVDNTVRRWDVSTGQPIGQPLQGHKARIASVAFSPDGKTIVSGSWDKTLRLWDAITGQPIGQPLKGHEFPVYSVAFSPDGRTIASGGADKTLRLWSLSWERLLQVACRQLQYHINLVEPGTDAAQEAKQTCDHYIWSKP